MATAISTKRPSAPLTPFNGDFVRLRDDMDRTFGRFFNEPFNFSALEPKALRAEGWLPAIDVSESDNEITVRAEVPGIPAKDVAISVSGNTLTISGQKDEKSEKTEENYYHCERRFGSFRRIIGLPDAADPDKVTAESDNGVVTVRIAKKPNTKSRQIEVKPVAKKVAING